VKVVIFCGGEGLRMRDAYDPGLKPICKPMIPIGGRPILWHVMKYYAHFGFTDFVLCLGHQAEDIRSFLLSDYEAMGDGSAPGNGSASVDQPRIGVHDWTITPVDTGLDASIGQRLRAVRHLLGGEGTFLANYADTLTDADLPAMIARARTADVPASLLAVRPNHSFHVVSMNGGGRVRGVLDVAGSNIWVNGGYFVLRSELLDEMGPDEDLVEVLHRLAGEDRLLAQQHDGFWASMDTFKDRRRLESLHASGRGPWQVWDVDRPDAVRVGAG
jgi:glucose-1-phosphate cytidylyltransferase